MVIIIALSAHHIYIPDIAANGFRNDRRVYYYGVFAFRPVQPFLIRNKRYFKAVTAFLRPHFYTLGIIFRRVIHIRLFYCKHSRFGAFGIEQLYIPLRFPERKVFQLIFEAEAFRRGLILQDNVFLNAAHLGCIAYIR